MGQIDVEVEKTYPPNWDLIRAALPHANESHTFCYGRKIYAPDGHDPPPDIVFHESVHMRQQGDDPESWWHAYLQDPEFRLEQEVQAYGEQWAWIKENIHGNAFRKWVLGNMATALSGPAYGDLVNYSKAESMIRNYGRK